MRRYKTNCKSDFLREVTEIIIMMLSPDEEMKGTILTVCHRSTEIDFESDQITISGTGMAPSSTSSSRVDTVGIEGGTIIIEITSSWCILVGIIDAKHYVYIMMMERQKGYAGKVMEVSNNRWHCSLLRTI